MNPFHEGIFYPNANRLPMGIWDGLFEPTTLDNEGIAVLSGRGTTACDGDLARAAAQIGDGATFDAARGG
jgi:hypothetical protein